MNILKQIIPIFFILCIAVLYFLDHSYGLTVLLIVDVFILIYFFSRIRYLNTTINWISPSIIFLIGYSIVHFQMHVYSLFGFESKGILFDFIWASEYARIKSLYISSFGLMSFVLGYILFFNSHYSKSRDSLIFLFYKKKNSNSSLIFLSYIFYFLFFILNSTYRTGTYQGSVEGISSYFYLLFNLFLTSSIVTSLVIIKSYELSYISLYQYLKKFPISIIFLTFWHILFSLFIGDRGPVISFGILVFGVYFFRFKVIKFYQILLVIIVGGTFFTLVGQSRRINPGSGIIQNFTLNDQEGSLSNRFDTAVPLEQTVELAMSVRCLNHVVDNVPSNYDFQYGYFQTKQILSVLPGGSSTIMKILNKDSNFDGSSNFITYLIQGNFSTYGDGTTIVADFYLDFGLIGVSLGLFLVGICFRHFEKNLLDSNQSLILFYFSLVYFSFSLYLSRSTFLSPLKGVVMGYFIVYLNYIFLRKNVL